MFRRRCRCRCRFRGVAAPSYFVSTGSSQARCLGTVTAVVRLFSDCGDVDLEGFKVDP